ncbi:sulfate/thiosulfate ABC transporter permease CysT [Vibrio cincinnatiensis]|uniref:Sulfate transport system permease protein CysT n=1 Tax=Vibrio cincinnatiensis DSM 19608 TaxID=1123491 RepID=A0A1T4S4M9_VIBCI|nr:sulfate/thiosulfate ABC transporter permease CysT [Vibrio cincinnatiensis]MCG3726544.1 sulfate/thiosulfate ABC transporter permease CysT [Vibrio cincinnatiensis]MCG3733925.1 sulfate/thiosulfate ABC transporter permease CysT [Vibrio cincinnatiensis]MCG3741076.1 sulfate/thiosulfate ABC transporter permease CysT [Vibrio cincinnatiensis]MCG3744609.1 sulfate/thiosulfate ABC transporter permease CysT [Vibrio cincinnatiensis]MCG3748187.1 sulfate/thiosulfate ABC transporter permease CysT [Vibrio ci
MGHSLTAAAVRPRHKRVLPGFGISLGTSLFFISLILLLPASGLIMQTSQMSLSEYWQVIADPRVVASYKVTAGTALIASLFNGLLGLLLAWVLVRYDFYGKRILDALVDLPFALPTAVAGITLATLYSSNGWVGSLLEPLGIKIAYTPLGIVLAMVFTSIPFVVRTVQPVLEEISKEEEEAGMTLGASDRAIFWKVIMPSIRPALLVGVALSFTRSLGEFGAVIFIAGNMPYISEITSLMIFVRLQEFDFPAASAIASVVLITSLLLLFAINVWQSAYLRRIHGR